MGVELARLASCALLLAGLTAPPAWAAADAPDPAKLAALFESLRADPHPDLKGIVILQHGRRVAEAYFNGDDADSLHDIRSATKSITSLLMGIAIDRHLVGGVDDPIARYLPGLPPDKATITIRDLLTMRSGLAADDDDPTSPGNEDKLDQAPDWTAAAYAVPPAHPPGDHYLYCSLNAFLVGAVVEGATRQPLDQFADAVLFGPLGIHRHPWRHVAPGHATGQGNLQLTARDVAVLGQLVLAEGRFRGRQLVSAPWVEASLSDLVDISATDPYADHYGYMWYARALPIPGGATLPVHFASGNGGNKIYLIPAADMVVAITSSAYGHGYGQKRSQEILLGVLGALR